jgi:hypothetical protein
MRGTLGNSVAIDRWYTVYDLNGNYDSIVGKNWMSANPHLIDHATNTVHLLRGDWSTLLGGLPKLVPESSIVGLRSHQGGIRETENYCRSVAEAAGISVISATSAHQNRDDIVLATVRFSQEPPCTSVTECSDNQIDVGDLSNKEFSNWRTKVTLTNVDLFKPPTDVPPPSTNDFRIVNDPLAKAPFLQPYRQSLAQREEFETQIAKLVPNGWVTESRVLERDELIAETTASLRRSLPLG